MTIYTQNNPSIQFSVPTNTPNGLFYQALNNWAAESVYVFNYTPQWVYFPDAQQYVPPWTSGAVLQLPQVAHAWMQFVSPPGVPQPLDTASPPTQAILVWVGESVPFATGISVSPIQVPGASWTNGAFPAVGSQALAEIDAGTNGTRHILTGFAASIASTSSLVGAADVFVEIQDGNTVIWVALLSVPQGSGNVCNVVQSGLELVGSPNTSMSVLFNAGVPNTQETISMCGYDAL